MRHFLRLDDPSRQSRGAGYHRLVEPVRAGSIYREDQLWDVSDTLGLPKNLLIEYNHRTGWQRPVGDPGYCRIAAEFLRAGDLVDHHGVADTPVEGSIAKPSDKHF